MIDQTDTTSERFVLAPGGMWRDLLTGRLIPAIFGADNDGDGDEGDDDDGDDDDGDGDGDDDEAEELQQLAAAMTKASKSGAKSALRKLARDHGFASRADLVKFLEEREGSNDDDDNDDDDDAGSTRKRKSSGDDDGPSPAVLRRERRLEIREALAEADVNPRKSKIAVATLSGLVDLTDPDLDEEDIEDAVEQMKLDEPGWFLDADGDDDEDDGGRVVPGASKRQKKKKVSKKSSAEIAREQYDRQKAASTTRKRLQSTQ